jgi:signal transduction histidine kinase
MAQLETVRASRARIVETADAERRRLERDLHDGAQQRLLMLAMTLRTMRAQASSPDADGALVTSIDRADRELASAMSELRELASGIHPIVLTRAGIGPALASLAELSTMPVTIDEVPAERLPPSVESTTFFVVSEALANAGKHARASHATVRVRRSNGDVIVEVADNGVGGASPGGGSGLVGLSDRVAAIGGSLEVMTPASGGTRLVARFPCPAPALVPQGGA